MSGLSTPVAPVDSVAPQPVLDVGPEPFSRREWIKSLWDHRGVIRVLAGKDFQARYKRTSLGVLWAGAVPLLQAAVLILVFSQFIQAGRGVSYAAYVLSGMLVWAGYFTMVVPQGTTAIVDGASLTDKLWFPRAILSLVPCLSNLVGLAIALVILLVAAPVLGEPPGLHSLLLIPACALLVSFTVALTMVLSALNVYFRDVRFIVTALMTVWMYATPILYPKSLVGDLGAWLDLNPMTGIISLFHVAVIGDDGSWGRAVVISVIATAVLLVAAVEAQRRHDRLFADLL
jgi:lipopolysaccharide transport system permease protein